MKSIKRNNSVILIFSLCLAVVVTAMLGSTTSRAEDVDVYMTTVKNSAMVVFDNSGSMSWPVFEPTFDYANFMKWMIDQGLASDDDNCRDGVTWWDSDGSGDDYDRLDPDQIYLVSSVVGHTMIDYTDSNGDPQQTSAINDVMWKTSSSNDSDSNPTASGSNYRDDWLKNTIIVAKNAAGEVWKLPATVPSGDGTGEEGDTGDTPVIDLNVDPEEVTIETVDGGDGHYYVLFPSFTENIDSGVAVDILYSGHGQRLQLAQDIPLTNLETDPRTGIVTDTGFLGALRTAGFYFAGVFEKSGGNIDFTSVDSAAEIYGGQERVYVFATGRWLNFMKLVEDFQANTYASSKDIHYWSYSFQQRLAWENICDKSAGEDEPGWTTQDTSILSHDTEYWCDEDENYCSGKPRDYPSNPIGEFLRGTIDPPGADTTEITYMRVRFQYIDTDACATGTNNDYVDLQDVNGNSLLAIKGQQIHPGSDGDEALVSYDGGETWQSPNQSTILDSAGYTEPIEANYLRVVWHNGNANGCSGYDQGFKITGFKFTSQKDIDTSAEAGEFYCSNAPSGYGHKVRSRMEVAKAAMKRVVDATSETLNWGITCFNCSPRLQQGLGSDVTDIETAIDGLEASGGTPMGTSMQDAYVADYDYYANTADPEDAECANKFMVVMTDGFPSGDSDWDRINRGSDTPVFNDVSKSYVDDDGWTDSGGSPNYSDDVAYWLKNEATYEHTVHAIGFTLTNPLLGDMADGSGGIYLTAYSEGQLVNAFHSLSLVMTSSQSFVAPVVSVDQANRTQSGDKIYTAFFRPKEGDFWVGNLKKYGLKLLTRSECGRSDPEITVVGANDIAATDCYGNFLPSATSMWSQVADGGEAAKGGVGAVLKDAMPGPHPTELPSQGGNWYNFRSIFTYDTSTDAWVRFIPANITNTQLDVSMDEDRFKLINFLYGYTYEADDTGDPKAKREWILGDIIHSEPTIIDYLDENNELFRRLIVVGGNDGMLHVFYDDDDGTVLSMKNAANFTEQYIPGREVWAFIPPDLLNKLKLLPDYSDHEYFVDGFSSLKRASYTFWKSSDNAASGPTGDTRVAPRAAGEYYKKTLVFGERRGGNTYWTLDVSEPNPLEWTVKWYTQGGQGDAFNELNQSWSKPAFATIRTGPNATDLKDVVVYTGGYDPLEDGYPEAWEDDDDDGVKDSGESYTETAGGTAGTYDYFNPDKDAYGRAIFVADLADGSRVFRATYDTATVATGVDQTYPEMKWSFPADPSVIPLSERKLVIYTPDIYGQVWRVNYSYTDSGGAWSVKRIFEVNPGSDQTGGTDFPPAPALNNLDKGRKMFYAPDISYRGSDWSGDDPVLYFGTGDRAHPRYVNWDGTNGFHERFYTVADTDSATPANETKLLNLTCDELDVDSDVDQNGTVDNNDATKRTIIRNMLYHWDDPDCSLDGCDYPAVGEQARGWYRIMGKQGDCLEDSYDHVGEKILSRPTLFFRVAYFTTFKPNFGNACNPNGDSLIYALDYNDGSAVFNLNLGNDPDTAGGDIQKDVTDTYNVVQDSTIPSGTRVITRQGRAAGVFSAGGSIVGAGDTDGTGTTTSIPGPPGGASKMLWETF